MARSTKDPAGSAKLLGVFIEQFSVKNSLLGRSGGSVNLSFSHKFNIETLEPAKKDGPCRAVLRMNMGVEGKVQDEQKPQLTVRAIYQARFVFRNEMAMKDVEEKCSSADYRHVLTAQAFAVAMSHLKQQLEMAGVSTRGMPIGLG